MTTTPDPTLPGTPHADAVCEAGLRCPICVERKVRDAQQAVHGAELVDDDDPTCSGIDARCPVCRSCGLACGNDLTLPLSTLIYLIHECPPCCGAALVWTFRARSRAWAIELDDRRVHIRQTD